MSAFGRAAPIGRCCWFCVRRSLRDVADVVCLAVVSRSAPCSSGFRGRSLQAVPGCREKRHPSGERFSFGRVSPAINVFVYLNIFNFSLAEPPASSFLVGGLATQTVFVACHPCRLVSFGRSRVRVRGRVRLRVCFDLSISRADGKRDCLSVALFVSCCGGRRRSAPMRRRNRAGSSREALIGSWSANDLPFFPRSEMRRSPSPSCSAGGGRGWVAHLVSLRRDRRSSLCTLHSVYRRKAVFSPVGAFFVSGGTFQPPDDLDGP